MSQFKSIVRQAVIDCSRVYEEVFVNYDYLVCSTAFKLNPFYVIDAKEDNYKHLTGVLTEMSALQFYRKCIDGSLTENDFGFEKAGQSKNEVRNFVKLKISILPFIGSIFSPDTLVEENFTKGRITCSFATSTSKLTLGFSVGKAVRPKFLENVKHFFMTTFSDYRAHESYPCFFFSTPIPMRNAFIHIPREPPIAAIAITDIKDESAW